MIIFFILVFIKLHFAMNPAIVFFEKKSKKFKNNSYFCKMCLCDNF